MSSALLLLLSIIPSYCTFWNGSTSSISTVGDSITVESGGQSYAANGGWRTWDVLHLNRWPEYPCSNITPLQCEYNSVQPRISLIQIGTNDPSEWGETWFSQNNIREIVQQTMARGILPVLYTIPANINKDVTQINQFIRELVLELDFPLIDYYAELSGLPNSGISSDGVHPSAEGYALREVLTLGKLEEIRAMCGW